MNKRALILGLIIIALIPAGVTSAAPEERLGHRMIYDPVDKRIVLYGGAVWDDEYTFYGELWGYDTGTNTWSEMEAANMPPARFNSMVTYIPGRHQLFLFGGFARDGRIDDTWVYDFASSIWTELNPTDHPNQRSDSSIVYDPNNDVVVLFSGYRRDEVKTRETWVYSFEEGNWVEMAPVNPPLHQYGNYMIHTETGQLLMYPGHWSVVSGAVTVNHGFGGNIWEYDYVGDQWTEIDSPSKPLGRYWGNLAYDSDRNRLVLFGGQGARDFDDTWAYDIETGGWEQASGDTRPSKRNGSNMVYDPEHDVFVMFGGMNTAGSGLDDTWILDAEALTWSVAVDLIEPEETSSTSIPGFPVWAMMASVMTLVVFWTHKNQ